MLFKGTDDPLGRGHRAAGGFDRRAARRLHLEGIRRLLHQGARRASAAGDRHPVRSRVEPDVRSPTTSSARRRSSSKRSRWSRTRPTISSTSSSPSRYWNGHPLGRPILGTPAAVSALDQSTLRRYFGDAYVADNFVVVAVGNLEHERGQRARRGRVRAHGAVRHARLPTSLPIVSPHVQIRQKELEQSHVCLGTHRAAAESSRSLCRLRAQYRARRVDELASLSERPREARPGLFGVFVAERVSGRRLRSASTPAAATRPWASSSTSWSPRSGG